MSAQRKVCILHVGGTIGMVWTDDGYVPHRGFVREYLQTMQEFTRPYLPSWDLVALEPLKDSANMHPRDWKRIAEAILERYDDYEGFVVLHGTDTMTYTASALSFLLEGLAKPVVFTGAQLSLEDVRSDGRQHIITALLIAGTLDIPEVGICFGNHLLRGNRTQKVNNAEFVAFRSGNFPPLVRAGVQLDVDRRLIRPPGDGLPDRIDLGRTPEVVSLRVFPGITPALLRRVLADPVEGVILETYGAGTFPTDDRALLEPVQEAIDRGVVVVNCSQCHQGRVLQGRYGTSATLGRMGVISGHDMTPEAALTKLFCLLGSGEPPDEAARRMEQDLAGEITPRPVRQGPRTPR